MLLPAIQPLLTTDFTCGYDNTFHLWRAVQVATCLRQGYLYPRWAPDMAHGYGYPLFVFHPPLTAYIAALSNLLGLPWPLAINATFILGMLLGGFFAFILARDLFGPTAALVAAVAYVYAPFQAYDVFNRGSLSESFAWAFPPLVLWAVHRWSVRAERRFLLLAAFSLAGLVLTHHLFAFLFAPLLALWILVEGYLARDWRVIGRGALAGLLGLGLCTFFWLPGLVERGWVQTGRLLGTWVFDYRNNFLDLRQLLAPPRAVDPTLINDWPPKALGFLPALAALLPLARWRWLDRSTRWRVGLLLASTAGFAFLTLPTSRLLWDHLPLLTYIQFPWRFLGPAAFCSALLAGVTACRLPLVTGDTPLASRLPLSAILVPLLLLGNLGWFYPRHCPPPQDTSIAGMIAWERQTDTLGTTAKGEYLPVWVHRMPEDQALDAAYATVFSLPLVGGGPGRGAPIVRLLPESLPEGARVLRADYGPVDATVVLDTPVPFRARYLAFYYPGWRVTVDGNPVSITPTDPDGLISFDVPAGHHTIHVRFGETPLRLFADALSFLTLIALLAFTIRPSRVTHHVLRFTFHVSRFTHHTSRITHHVSRLTSHVSRITQSAFRNPQSTIVHCSLFTLLFLAALALNLSPYLRGPDEWRWVYAIPGKPARLLIPALTLLLYLALVFVWMKRMTNHATRNAHHPIAHCSLSHCSLFPTWGFLICLVLAVPLIQASLLTVEHRDVLRPLFYRTVSAGASGVFSVGSTIENAGDFLRRYPTLMPTFPVHPQRYPPGLPLLFYLTRRLLEKTPALADGLGFRLRLYQCHDLSLMRLPNATISTAAIQMALPLVSGLTLLPLYGLARRAYGQRTAAWVVALYPLVPSFALWSARWEQFYPLLACTAWYFFHIGLTRRSADPQSAIYCLAAGFTLSIASLLNFGTLALLLPMGLFALLWFLTQPSAIRHSLFAIRHSLVFLAGLASPWLIYQLAFGTGFLDIWHVSMSYHLGLHRSYWTWLGYHLYDFFIFLGLPLTFLFLLALVKAIRDLLRHLPFAIRHSPFTLSFALGLLLLDLSGTARGEVARVWLFLTPFAALVAARGLTRLRLGQSLAGFALVAFLLALQLFTFNAFLRVVTTGLSDPPSRAHVFEPPPIAHPLEARFGDSIALLGYDLEKELPPSQGGPGGVLHLTLYWQALKPVTRPYTVFTHLVGPDGQLVGQQDNMPLQDTAPTTCWVPGEVIADPYDVPISPQATPGNYVLEMGLYLWETGERLPATGPTATPDHRVILTSIWIGDR